MEGLALLATGMLLHSAEWSPRDETKDGAPRKPTEASHVKDPSSFSSCWPFVLPKLLALINSSLAPRGSRQP